MWSAYNLVHVYEGDSPQADHLVIFNILYVWQHLKLCCAMFCIADLISQVLLIIIIQQLNDIVVTSKRL